MTDQVQRQKVKIQSNDTFTFEIEDYLGIEGNRPGEEVDPSDDLNEDIRRFTSGNIDQKKVVRWGDVHFWWSSSDNQVTLPTTMDGHHTALIITGLFSEGDIGDHVDVLSRIDGLTVVEKGDEDIRWNDIRCA